MGEKAVLPAARGLTRLQVAELLGITDRDVARMDGRQLHPTRALDRAWRYDAREVRALMLNGPDARSAADAPEPDGEVTAAAFALFQARKATYTAVIELRQPASVVQRLRAQYDDMRGSLALPAAVVGELRGSLERPFSTPRQLVEAVRDALEARFDEGRAEAQDCGAVLDPVSGKLRPVMPRQAELPAGPGLPALDPARMTEEEGSAVGASETPGNTTSGAGS